MAKITMTEADKGELAAKLRTAKTEQQQFEQPVNQQLYWGNQVFLVAADSDVDQMISIYEENGPSDRPIGPEHLDPKTE